MPQTDAAPAKTSAAPAAAAAPEVPVFNPPPGQRLYEVMWVVDANAGRENFTKVMAGLKELVEKSSGTWVNGDKWEERRLAYSIKKKKRGLYILAHFTTAPENIVKLERNIQISDLALRALITVDLDGISTSPPVREIEDDEFGMGGGGGGERRFFGGGGGGGDRGGRPRFSGGRGRDSKEE